MEVAVPISALGGRHLSLTVCGVNNWHIENTGICDQLYEERLLTLQFYANMMQNFILPYNIAIKLFCDKEIETMG